MAESTPQNLLPIVQAFKVTPKSVYVGDPKQLVDLLSSGVATPILEIARTKSNMPLYKFKLRCRTLFAGNLDIYFLSDYPNQTMKSAPSATSEQGAVDEVVIELITEENSGRVKCEDSARAIEYSSNLENALTFWAALMEAEVERVYPDKTPIQTDKFCTQGILSMKPNVFSGKVFDLPVFLADCDRRKGIPCFKVSYGWIASKEDPRSKDHLWGIRFELSPYPQYPATVRARKPVSASEKQKEIVKKRKVELEAGEEADSIKTVG